jgi:hypothetical protein
LFVRGLIDLSFQNQMVTVYHFYNLVARQIKQIESLDVSQN